MTRIIFLQPDGTTRVVDAKDGLSVMEVAITNDVAGIDAECGGACACATCHVYVGAEWFQEAGAPAEFEQGMLEMVLDVRPNSRLSCQIKVSAGLDGAVLEVPAKQGT